MKQYSFVLIMVSIIFVSNFNHVYADELIVDLKAGKIKAIEFFGEKFFSIGRTSFSDAAKNKITISGNTFGDATTPGEGKNEVGKHLSYFWDVVGQSSCSLQSDGTASIIRNIKCFEYSGLNQKKNEVPKTYCNIKTKPKEYIPCLLDGLDYQWTTTNVSTCSASCGVGEVQRESFCIYKNNITNKYEKVQDLFCIETGHSKPTEYSSCESYKNCSVSWSYDEWEQCSEPCGNKVGISTRAVFCKNLNGFIVDSSLCQEIYGDPITERECQSDTVCEYDWIASEWSTCSSECGDGDQLRSVQCINTSSEMPADNESLCLGSKPDNFQACNNHCATSCQNILDSGLSIGSGNYQIWNNGAWANVYCHMTLYGGGWTKTATINYISSHAGLKTTDYISFSVNPYEFNESQIMFVDKGNTVDWATSTWNLYRFYGINPYKIRLRFAGQANCSLSTMYSYRAGLQTVKTGTYSCHHAGNFQSNTCFSSYVVNTNGKTANLIWDDEAWRGWYKYNCGPQTDYSDQNYIKYYMDVYVR